jgi:hypothetical protein
LLLLGVFWEKRFFLIIGYELPIAFPHKKIHNFNFFTFGNCPYLNFHLQFEKEPSFKATLNVFLGFHKYIYF